MKDSTKYISYHEFEERLHGYQIKFSCFSRPYIGIKKNRDCLQSRNKECEDFHEEFLKIEKANRVVYERLVRIKQQRPTRSQEKCFDDCELGNDETILH